MKKIRNAIIGAAMLAATIAGTGVAHADTSGCSTWLDGYAGITQSYNAQCVGRIAGGPTQFRAWATYQVGYSYTTHYGAWHNIGSGTSSTAGIGFIASKGVDKR